MLFKIISANKGHPNIHIKNRKPKVAIATGITTAELNNCCTATELPNPIIPIIVLFDILYLSNFAIKSVCWSYANVDEAERERLSPRLDLPRFLPGNESRSLDIVDLIWYSASGLPDVVFVGAMKFLKIYITLLHSFKRGQENKLPKLHNPKPPLGSSIKDVRKNTCFPTSGFLVRFCPHVAFSLPCRHPHLSLDTGRVIAGALKMRCSLISSSQHAAQSKDKINRDFM